MFLKDQARAPWTSHKHAPEWSHLHMQVWTASFPVRAFTQLLCLEAESPSFSFIGVTVFPSKEKTCLLLFSTTTGKWASNNIVSLPYSKSKVCGVISLRQVWLQKPCWWNHHVPERVFSSFLDIICTCYSHAKILSFSHCKGHIKKGGNQASEHITAHSLASSLYICREQLPGYDAMFLLSLLLSPSPL